MLSIRQVAQFRQRVVKHAHKKGNISETARLYKVSRQSLYRWIKRYDGTIQSLMDRSKRPKSHPREHTRQEIEMILRVQRHNRRLGLMCLWIQLKIKHGYSRSLSALYRVLRRKGVIELHGRQGRASPSHTSRSWCRVRGYR